MKKYILLACLFFSPLAQADFGTGLIVGSLLSSGPRNTTVEVKDEFAKQVEQIESSLPNKYSSTALQPSYTFAVDPKESQKYLNYFKNGGHAVTYQKGQLTFDYSSKYQAYLRYEEQRRIDQAEFDRKWEKAKPYVKGVGYFILGIILLSALVSAINETRNSGIAGALWKVEKRLLEKVINDLNNRKK